ncbi:unnamed protein product, partial [Leptidea sinapis]
MVRKNLNLFAAMQIAFIWLFFLFSHARKAGATTHWMVTESGLIQPRIDSPFEIARPYDLLSFLKQDTHWEEIKNLYNELSKKQDFLDNLWSEIEKDTDLGIDVGKDENCMRAGPLNMIDWYHTPLEDGTIKNIPEKDFLLPKHFGASSESMIERNNISIAPEYPSLEFLLPFTTSVDQMGHWLTGVLKRNTSSWLHYNLASLYWRIKGNAPKAIECCRRAIHYAPRHYEDALIILNGAVDHDFRNPISHFVLANLYTYIGEYNASLVHYKICLKINSKMEIAKKHTYATLCHIHVKGRMKNMKKIHKLREELNDYSLKESLWIKTQSEFLKTMKQIDGYDYKNVEKNSAKMSELTGLPIAKLKQSGDKYSLIKYFFDGTMFDGQILELASVPNLDAIYTLQRIVGYIQKHSNTPEILAHLNKGDKESKEDLFASITNIESGKSKEALSDKSMPKEKSKKDTQTAEQEKNHTEDAGDDLTEYETDIFLEDFDTDPDWPSDEFCLFAAPNFPDKVEALYPVFLPLENKGIRVRSLLTDKIGVPLDVEHELPWHPPNCLHEKDSSNVKKNFKQHVTEVVDTGYLREMMLKYVSDGDPEHAKHMQEVEIGHRIYVAMRKRLAPKWIGQVLASLYWRVRGNRINALHCLQAATRSVHPKYKEIVLVSLGSVYMELGYFDEAPATNFLMAQLNNIKQHRLTQMFHLEQVIRVEPGFMSGLVRNLLNTWACVEGDVCTQVQPGINMVCEKGGANCHMTSIRCFSKKKEDTSTLMSLLEQNEYEQYKGKNYINDKFFEIIIQNTPASRHDTLAHHTNYDHMMKAIDTVLKGCGPHGCRSMNPLDASMTEEECEHHSVQFGYWLHIVSFKQLLTDSNKVPDCKSLLSSSEDFYIQRLSRIDTTKWEPIMSLTHQFTELFYFDDYLTLGAMIAKYVETKEYDQAVWMYRYALAFDEDFKPAKACLHATMCSMFFGDGKSKK